MRKNGVQCKKMYCYACRMSYLIVKMLTNIYSQNDMGAMTIKKSSSSVFRGSTLLYIGLYNLGNLLKRTKAF